MEYYSAIKKTALLPFAAIWMDLGIIIPSKQKEKCYTSLFCGIWKIIQMNMYANRNRLTDTENRHGYQTEGQIRGMELTNYYT